LSSGPSKHLSVPKSPEVSTPRLWSKLPCEPGRDSWLPKNPYDDHLVKDPMSVEHRQSKVTWDPSTRSPDPAPRTSPLSISNLRAHALARAKTQSKSRAESPPEVKGKFYSDRKKSRSTRLQPPSFEFF
jgi:hypothetical protein